MMQTLEAPDFLGLRKNNNCASPLKGWKNYIALIVVNIENLKNLEFEKPKNLKNLKFEKPKNLLKNH